MFHFVEVIIELISNTNHIFIIYINQTSLSLIQLIYHNTKVFIKQILLHKKTNFIINYLSNELYLYLIFIYSLI